MTINELRKAAYHLHQLATQLNEHYLRALDQIFFQELTLIGNHVRAVLPEDSDELIPNSLPSDFPPVPHFTLSVNQAGFVVQAMSLFGIPSLLTDFFRQQLNRKDQQGQNAYDYLVFGKAGVSAQWQARYNNWSKQVLLMFQNKVRSRLNEIAAQENATREVLDELAENTRQSQELEEQMTVLNQLQKQVAILLQD